MTRRAIALFQCTLVAAGFLLTIPESVSAADRGGMRQEPLSPPAGMKPGRTPTPAPTRPRIIDPPGPQRSEEPRQSTDSAVISFKGSRYVISEGRWFEQRGNKLLPVSPPEGVLVQELPPGYSVRWVGGVPYFQADGLYYVWRERKRSYEILTSPPAGGQERAPPP